LRNTLRSQSQEAARIYVAESSLLHYKTHGQLRTTTESDALACIRLSALIAPHDISTASRALYRAIEELERHRAARKAREESAASMDAEPAKRPAGLNEGQPEKHGKRPVPRMVAGWIYFGAGLG
jgi:hypothetical protein